MPQSRFFGGLILKLGNHFCCCQVEEPAKSEVGYIILFLVFIEVGIFLEFYTFLRDQSNKNLILSNISKQSHISSWIKLQEIFKFKYS